MNTGALMHYHTGKNGEQTGPFTADDIRARIKEGLLLPNDLVWSESWTDWRKIGEVPEFGGTSPIPANPLIHALTGARRDYMRHFLPLALITAIIWVPLNLLSSWMDYHVFGEDQWMQSIRFHLKLDSFLGIIATAGVLCWLRDHHQGQRPGVRSSLRNGLRFWGRLFLANLLSGLLFVLGLLALVLPSVWVAVRLSLVEVVVVLEGGKTTDCLRRSWTLTGPHFWLLLGLSAAVGLACCLPVVPLLVFIAFFPEYDYWWLDAASCIAMEFLYLFFTIFYFHAWKGLSAGHPSAESGQPPAPAF